MPKSLLNISSKNKLTVEQIEALKQEPAYIQNIFLFAAAHNGDLDFIDAFLKDPEFTQKTKDLVDEYGNTLLMVATSKGYINIVDELLKKGADPRKKNKDGSTILHIAAANGNLKLFCKILFTVWSKLKEDFKYDLNKFITEFKTNDDHTILHIAAEYGNYHIVKLILCLCLIKFDIINKERIITATDDDYTKYYFGLFSKLLSKGNFKLIEKSNVEELPIILQVIEKDSSIDNLIKLILFPVYKAKVLLDPLNKKGETPLHLAAKGGCMSVVTTLISAKADRNIANSKKLTAVDVACKYENYHVVAAILGNKDISYSSFKRKVSFSPSSLGSTPTFADTPTSSFSSGISIDNSPKIDASRSCFSANSSPVIDRTKIELEQSPSKEDPLQKVNMLIFSAEKQEALVRTDSEFLEETCGFKETIKTSEITGLLDSSPVRKVLERKSDVVKKLKLT